jgi:hypothetical protein
LLANFIPHDDKLELVVLGFYAQRYFDSEAGSTHNVVLEHARELPEVQTARSLASLASTRQRQDLRSNNEGEGRAQLTKTNESATGAKSARDEPSEADIVAARNELKKELSRFESQSMYRQMAHKLADNRIKDGRSGSRLTALPIAHASVLGGLARSQAIALASNILTQATTVADSISTQMPEPLRQMIAQRVPSPTPAIKAPIILANANRRLTTPRGQQYQISKKEFVNFYEDRWLLDPENASADEKGDSTAADLEREELTIEQTVDPSGTAGSMLRERRNGLLIKGQNLQVLKRLLAQNASPVGRRDARLIESDMVGELKEMLGDAESLRNKRSSDVS